MISGTDPSAGLDIAPPSAVQTESVSTSSSPIAAADTDVADALDEKSHEEGSASTLEQAKTEGGLANSSSEGSDETPGSEGKPSGMSYVSKEIPIGKVASLVKVGWFNKLTLYRTRTEKCTVIFMTIGFRVVTFNR